MPLSSFSLVFTGVLSLTTGIASSISAIDFLASGQATIPRVASWAIVRRMSI